MPFHTCDIVRGSQRGLSKGWLSWGFLAKKTDECGQVTEKKVVGKFKGRIHIENIDEKETFRKDKEDRSNLIFSLLRDIY